jgi:hypothetical protein
MPKGTEPISELNPYPYLSAIQSLTESTHLHYSVYWVKVYDLLLVYYTRL